MSEIEKYTLGLVAEEAGEVLQWIGKALRFGIDTPGKLDASGRVSGETPRTLLPGELGDLLAAVEFMMLHGIVERQAVIAAKAKKLARLTDLAALDNLGRPLAPQPARLDAASASAWGAEPEIFVSGGQLETAKSEACTWGYIPFRRQAEGNFQTPLYTAAPAKEPKPV